MVPRYVVLDYMGYNAGVQKYERIVQVMRDRFEAEIIDVGTFLIATPSREGADKNNRPRAGLGPFLSQISYWSPV